MKPLVDLIQEFKNLIPIGIDLVFKTLKQHIPASSIKYNGLIELEARYRENHKKIHKGTISNNEAILANNQIREALLVFIDGLEEKDFDPNISSANKKGQRTGKILYRIPEVMQVEIETTCLVRIAFDEETLTYDITIQSGDEIKELRRVSEVMSVELIDPSEHHPFTIRSYSESIQFVDEDDYTEWKFFVKPQNEGEFPLLLKVSVIELKLGKERKRDIVLEERVQIVTSPPVLDNLATKRFKIADETLNTATSYRPSKVLSPTPDDIQSSPYTSPKVDKHISSSELEQPNKFDPPPIEKSRKLKGTAKKGVVYMLALLLFTSATWAVPTVREEVRWVNTALLQNNKEAYVQYKERYPESRRMEKIENRIEEFEWKEVINSNGDKKIEELKDFRKKYVEFSNRYYEEATDLLTKLEYDRISNSNSIDSISNFIDKYPNSKFTNQAIELFDRLKKSDLDANREKNKSSLKNQVEEYDNNTSFNKKRENLTQTETDEQPDISKLQSADESAWEKAKRINTLNAYQEYVKQFPAGKYLAEAKRRIKIIQERKQKEVRQSMFSAKSGIFKDPRDGQSYSWALMKDGKIWMTTDLNYSSVDSWCYGDNEANCKNNGRLYTWDSAKKACPSSWRLPTDQEWQKLAKAYGGYFDLWNVEPIGRPRNSYQSLFGSKSIFKATLGGHRNNLGKYGDQGRDGNYWSSTKRDRQNAWYYGFSEPDKQLIRNYGFSTSFGFSCRCILD